MEFEIHFNNSWIDGAYHGAFDAFSSEFQKIYSAAIKKNTLMKWGELLVNPHQILFVKVTNAGPQEK